MTSGPAGSHFSIGDMWLQRVQALLLSHEGPTLVLAERDSGIDFAVASLGSSEYPLVWFRLDSNDLDDGTSQGSKLSDAMARALGTVLFGSGLPISHAVTQVSRMHATVGPFIIVASNAEFLGSGADELLKLSALGSKVILVFGDQSSLNTTHRTDNCHVVSAIDLAVKHDEAIELAAGRLGADDLDSVLDEGRSQFLPLLRMCSERFEAVPVVVPDPFGASVVGLEGDDVDSGVLIDALIQRGRSVEAFEVALRSGGRISDELIDVAGWELATRGLHERLWRMLSTIPKWQRQQSPVLMRWYFATATAVNRHGEVKAEVYRYLQDNVAPELRALFAAAYRGPDFVKQTAAALAALRSPTTLRMHAFALAMEECSAESARYLQKALRLSEVLGQDSIVVACATDLADYWIKRGQYKDAVEWAKWALDWSQRSGQRDELRRLAATAMYVYAKILVGEVTDLEDAVCELDVGLAGIPTAEAIVSTRADWEFVSGNLVEAERLYSVNIDNCQLGTFHDLAVDHIHVLMSLNRVRQAQGIARRAYVLAPTSSPHSATLGKLAAGIAQVGVSPNEAIQLLTEAQYSLTTKSVNAPRLAQATIALAKAYLRRGDDVAVRETLQRGKASLEMLGYTGWTLLGGPEPEVKFLHRLFKYPNSGLELRFLGADGVMYRGKQVDLGLRQLECLVVLASRDSGVSADRLAHEVYGDAANISTAKAIISRLRGTVPISSRPYRIQGTVYADFLEVERMLVDGRFQEAVFLYGGPLLPTSQAPAVVELREHLDEMIRRSVMASGDVEAMLQLARCYEDDVELYEAALKILPPSDSRRPIVCARTEQVRRNWQRG